MCSPSPQSNAHNTISYELQLNGLESSSEDQEDIPPAPVSAGHKARTDDSDDEDVLPDDLELTADQRLAMMELGSMKLDLGYTGRSTMACSATCTIVLFHLGTSQFDNS